MATGTAGGSPAGLSVLGQQVSISAPNGTAQQPLQLVLTLDATLVGANPPASILVFRSEGGAPATVLADCGGAAGTASPDPCVASRTSHRRRRSADRWCSRRRPASGGWASAGTGLPRRLPSPA